MTKSEVRERLQAFIIEILDDDRLVDEYDFRNLSDVELIHEIEQYLFDE